jgi:hypothetical protein
MEEMEEVEKVLLNTKEEVIRSPVTLNHFKFLNKILDMASAYINAKDENDEFIFLNVIMVPLMNQVLIEGGSCEMGKNECYNFCKDLFVDHNVLLRIDGCQPSCFGQTSKLNNTDFDANDQILLNPSWVCAAERECDLFLDSNDYESAEVYELNVHLVVGMIRFIHEYLQTFTSAFLDKERETSRAKQRFKNTPVKMGIKFLSKNKVCGDTGNAGEELIFGKELRLKMEYNKQTWAPECIYFEEAKIIIIEKNTSGSSTKVGKGSNQGKGSSRGGKAVATSSKRGNTSVKAPKGKGALKVAAASSKTDSTENATFSKLKFTDEKDELQYLSTVRKTFEEYLEAVGKGADVDGNDLYNVLKILGLQQFDEDPVLEIKINAKMKFRKNSETGMTLNESFECVNGEVPEEITSIPLTDLFGNPAKE